MRKRRCNGKRAKKMRWQTRKKRYNGNLRNCEWGQALRTTDGKRIKRKFELVVKLIANKYYIDLFHYLFYPLFITPSMLVDPT